MAGLTIADAQDIFAAYQYRQEHFAEDCETSMLVVLLNHGAHLTPVSCIAGEWSGVKGDLTPRTRRPHVPERPRLHRRPWRQARLRHGGGVMSLDLDADHGELLTAAVELLADIRTHLAHRSIGETGALIGEVAQTISRVLEAVEP